MVGTLYQVAEYGFTFQYVSIKTCCKTCKWYDDFVFTFQYVSIKTDPEIRYTQSNEPNLHSNMFLLRRRREKMLKIIFVKFTFQYVSIKTADKEGRCLIFPAFTFQYVSIKTRD